MATDNLMPQSSTSIIKHFMLRSSSTGQGLTGKVASDFTGKYNIAGGAEVTLSFSSGTAGDAYSSGKIVPLGLGKYAWHVPNAVFASLGNVSAVLSVTGGIDVHFEWLVVAVVRDTVRFGASDGTGVSLAANQDVRNVLGSVSGAVGSVTGAVGSVTGNVGGNLNGNVSGNVSGSVGSVTGAVGSVTGSVGSVVGNVGGSTASVAGSVGSVTGDVGGNVSGKVLGGGAGTISGDGVRAASVTGAVGSVTGAVGSVVGAVVLDSASLRSALGMSAADLDSQLDAILAAASAGAGTGARTVTITVNDGTTVLQNAIVRFTEGSNTFRAVTNASGMAVFNLDDATYTVAVTKSGYTYAGTTMVVNGTETATYSMTAVSITPPTNPDLSAVIVLCLGTDFEPQTGVTIDLRIVTLPTGSTDTAYPGVKQTAISNGSGIATLQAPKGSICEWKRGKEDSWTEITIGNNDQTNVTSIIGSRY